MIACESLQDKIPYIVGIMKEEYEDEPVPNHIKIKLSGDRTILIGINVPAATIPLEIRAEKVGQPYAIKSPLGWLIYGLPGKNANIQSLFCTISSITNVRHEKSPRKGGFPCF